MKDNTVLVLGGYGNAGLAIARLLLSQTKVGIILAGRAGDRAQRVAQELNAEFQTDCVSGMQVNAASKESLIQAFQQVGIVVVASSTIEFAQIVAEAALEAGIDYFDVQISATAKRQALEIWMAAFRNPVYGGRPRWWNRCAFSRTWPAWACG